VAIRLWLRADGHYGLPVSDDPSSVLFKDILGPDDLDRVSEDF